MFCTWRSAMRLAAAAAAGSMATGWAQVYTFHDEVIPDERSLHTLYAFYVYSYQDAPERTLGPPFVEFRGLTARPTLAARSDAEDYQGIQLSLVRYKDFWGLIDPNKFCSTRSDVQEGLAEREDQLLLRKPIGVDNSGVGVYSHTVRFPSADTGHLSDMKTVVRSTGVYVLVLSNCGAFSEATVSGSVIVKNAYGFLPGNEYHKMTFYSGLSLIYAGMAVVWFGISLRWRRELFRIQYCIAAVILYSLVHAFLAWSFYCQWNRSGVRGKVLFIIVILSSVVKSILSYMLFLVASLGWGFTQPYLDRRTIKKVQVLSSLYIVLGFIREYVLFFRHSHSLSVEIGIACLLPVTLLNCGTFCWISVALRRQMRILTELRQHEKLQLFLQLRRIFAGALTLASLSFLFQIFDASRSISGRWQYQWLFSDGVWHILFLLVLAAVMHLWAPHTNSQRHAWWEQERTATLIDAGQQIDGDSEDHEDLTFSIASGQSGCALLRSEARGMCLEICGLIKDAAGVVPCICWPCRCVRWLWGGCHGRFNQAPQRTADVALRSAPEQGPGSANDTTRHPANALLRSEPEQGPGPANTMQQLVEPQSGQEPSPSIDVLRPPSEDYSQANGA